MVELLYRIPPWVIIALVAHFAILGTVAYLILLERKIASWAQDRLGPNRVGPKGLLQPIADGLKFIFKEDFRPAGVDRFLFTLAPAIMIVVIIISIAVIPWGGVHQVTRAVEVTPALSADEDPAVLARATQKGTAEYLEAKKQAEKAVPLLASRYGEAGEPRMDGDGSVVVDLTYRYPFQIARLNIGALFVIAILSLAVYGVVLGGWASNNKYSFLGGLRATAQMVSYEIPLGLSLLAIVVMFGTIELGEIVNNQAHYWLGVIPAWNVFVQPLAFLMFLICIHAEANRAPFDLAEAEQELVGGYHTEYSAMRFALFFLAEYAGMITTSAVCVALFFGGWHVPWIERIPLFSQYRPDALNPEVTTSLGVVLVRSLVFFAKTLVIIAVFMWVRWSLPRFRFDQLMMLAWRALIPMSLAMLMVTAVVIYFFGRTGRDLTMRVNGTLAMALLASNVIVLAATMLLSKVLPAPPETNRRLRIAGSRFNQTPLPAGVQPTT